jgi:hypothetical protein
MSVNPRGLPFNTPLNLCSIIAQSMSDLHKDAVKTHCL